MKINSETKFELTRADLIAALRAAGLFIPDNASFVVDTGEIYKASIGSPTSHGPTYGYPLTVSWTIETEIGEIKIS